ncbi:MAG: sigma-70 family RNA polymerase sigma factor [Bacteroidales bacterium]|nr:sigma-70 family RNA polymerase sigma factor [Bacteroidales bacterium]
MEPTVKNIHEDLIRGCRVNDRKAQVQVYKLYYKAMYNTALRILNDTAEAEDVMQEAFLEAFKNIDTYREESSFGAWLKRIVINKSIDELRKAKDLVYLDEVEIEIADKADEEDFIRVLSTKVEEIRKAIHRLPDSYRVILSLYLLEGYDHEEIAQILDISYNLSRTRYSRARRKLLDYLGAVENGQNMSNMN